MLMVPGMPSPWEEQRHSNEKCVLSSASNPDVSRDRSQVGKLPASIRKVLANNVSWKIGRRDHMDSTEHARTRERLWYWKDCVSHHSANRYKSETVVRHTQLKVPLGLPKRHWVLTDPLLPLTNLACKPYGTVCPQDPGLITSISH